MSSLDGYRKEIEFIRETEFPQLKGSTYVEHVGATLFSKSQMEAYQSELLSNLYGNPHSRSQSSMMSTDVTDQIRYRVLRHFNTTDEEYSVIFTTNCTGALKLIAEHFNFKGKYDDEQPEGSNPDQTADDRNCRCGCFCYLLDNHTSVQGMRGAVKDRVCNILCLDEEDLEKYEISKSNVIFHQQKQNENDNCLFAYPAQSNFSGRKYPLSWIGRVRRSEFPFQGQFPGKWYSVLDAAAYVSTSPLDLDLHKPDFVTLSFYKMMGFPTSLGCLLVHNNVGYLLQKRYFGGGSVTASSATDMYAQFRMSLSDRFEDGTIPFLEIMALRHGFDVLERLGGGMRAISSHTFSLSRHFYNHLSRLTHRNGQRLAVIYCSGTGYSNGDTQGAIVNFNLRRANGDYIGFAEVDKLAQLYNIHLRTGCFCNIGCCQKYLSLTSEQIKENFQAGHVCGDDKDVINGKPTGSVRISFGYMSTIQDVHHCLHFITECFLEDVTLKQNYKAFSQSQHDYNDENPKFHEKVCDKRNFDKEESENSDSFTFDNQKIGHSSPVRNQSVEQSASIHVPNLHASHEKSVAMETESVLLSCDKGRRMLTDICLYPVKSCAAFKVSSWEIGPTGLLYDRCWMVVSPLGVAISQKREPLMCMIKPILDLTSHTLTLTYKDMDPLKLPIDNTDTRKHDTALMCSSKVCGDRIQGVDCGDEAGYWLSQALQRLGCRLIQQDMTSHRKTKLTDTDENSTADSVHQGISLANESQYLLVTRSSMDQLMQKILEGTSYGNQDQENVDHENLISRFRGNLVIGGGQPLEEDSWNEIQIGAHTFVSQGGCSRCQMICLDQESGTRSKEPLRTLAVWRGRKVPFGIHIRNEQITKGTLICIGDPVHIKRTNSVQ